MEKSGFWRREVGVCLHIFRVVFRCLSHQNASATAYPKSSIVPTTGAMDDALSDLLASLPKNVVPERGLVDSLRAIGVRDASRPALPEVSASRQLLLEKQEKAAAESTAVPFTIPPSAPKPTNPLHDAIVSGHKANMAEILARKGGMRQKSKRANHKDKASKEKAAAYGERFTAKTGGREKRAQRLGAFKKIY